MTQTVDNTHGDLILMVCYIITGLADSSSISKWGSFVSMQTGNTVYIGVGLSDLGQSTRWIKASTSVGFFCIGSFVFARWHRNLGPLKRWVMLLSYLVQLLCIIAAAIIVMVDKTQDDASDIRWHVLAPIAFVAFQSGGQAVTSRALNFNALTSVVLTSIYCDLFSDAKLFAGLTQNVQRNQRVGAPLALLVGAIGGGLWARTAIGLAGALWTAAGLKLVIICAWMTLKPKKE